MDRYFAVTKCKIDFLTVFRRIIQFRRQPIQMNETSHPTAFQRLKNLNKSHGTILQSDILVYKRLKF